MFAAYVTVTILLAAGLTFSAGCDFVRYEQVAVNMAAAGVPESWMTPLGAIKAVGAAGLLVGMVVPLIGVAAAVGVIAFFVLAVAAHVRAGSPGAGLPAAFGLLAVLALTLRLATL